ncbi:asparagine synthase (glutamine-hydrolyzing) [Halorussus sp. MSC15.2]|uniref:asparagine synthase (glutamine-hydrolyzing) n=1 Tax=Halorussus sp. MSC15.2 TaxID=2283638 RepID=UPI0013D1CA27|nr:asparagine synthase (glutamine-hydrolyzing) [Halorussus sp. MSC15.2]NEU55655.1 asparagine synthase (glutamine-hydrolyzing) [Halorussus sp. MSC15.2]
MCGIAGVLDSKSHPRQTDLARMNESMEHRGPDDSGIYCDGPIGLTHRRLSIIDLSSGHQPIFNEDESVAVVFNGEIYNYTSLRSSLSSVGHTFSTDTDTEVLVHLYEEHGPSFVERLEGMFAFAIWDSEKERLVLARDRMGIKPLLLASDDDAVAFASELPALLKAEVNHGGLDRTAIAQYFAFGFIPSQRTAFKNITKLRPGELAIVSEDGVQRESFYSPSITPREPGLDTAATELRERVERSVERRLQSDVPLGAFLSGGIDSSIVVGTMAQISDEPVKTFTVGFDEELFDESWAAREVASFHNTNHHEFTVSPDDVRELIPKVVGRLGEPFADQSLLPTFVVAQKTRQNVKVALSGDGADELFAGYGKYRGEYYSQYYRTIPRSLRRRLIQPAVESLPASRTNTVGEFSRKAQKFLRGGQSDTAARHFEWLRIHDNSADRLFDDISPSDVGRNAISAQHAELESWLPPSRRDALSRMQAVDTGFSLPNQMLQKVDTASMFNSLEVRVPFLDTAVVEYAMSLPTSYKITPRTQKRVLIRAFEDRLPRSILKRDKQGFDMPIGEWFKDELATEFCETLRSTDTELLDTDEVRSVYTEHCTGNREHGKFLWSVYVFLKWLKRMRTDGVL